MKETEEIPNVRTMVHIRWMVRADMPAVLAIEHASFEHPWTEEDFLKNLRLRNIIGMVALDGDRVVGYMVYELTKGKIVLLNMAVSPDRRREGAGRQMVDKLIEKVSGPIRDTLTVHVSEALLDAQLFFKATGLRAVAVERGFFADTGEDAYVMEIRKGGTVPDSTVELEKAQSHE